MNEQLSELDDFVCITCSDQALPAKVVGIDDALGLATVELAGGISEVDISLVDDVELGDLLLVHGGVALSNQKDELQQ